METRDTSIITNFTRMQRAASVAETMTATGQIKHANEALDAVVSNANIIRKQIQEYYGGREEVQSGPEGSGQSVNNQQSEDPGYPSGDTTGKPGNATKSKRRKHADSK